MRIGILAAAVSIGLAASAARAESETQIEIAPGPATITAEEKAIVPDAAAGAQHAVILVEEADRDENHGTGYVYAYHLRAKILSAEGRSLADVEIPGLASDSDLKTWWGRTLLPDGTSVDLRREDLVGRMAAKVGLYEVRTVKAALPGVVPGSVIDYGYVVRGEGVSWVEQVFLQKEWPIRQFRYRWVPSTFLAASYLAAHTEGKAVEVKRDKKSVLVTGHDLAPVATEPLMPPPEEVRASMTFYYSRSNENPDEYWELQAKRRETELRSFIGNGSAIRESIEQMKIAPGTPLPGRLQAAYEWIAANVKNLGLMSAEEEEAHDDSRDADAYNAKSVLKAGQGTGRQLDELFAGMARALGAEANLAFTTDRTERFWKRALKSFGQFTYSFVAVRAPGEPDDALVFVDAGSGLPYGQVPWPATGTQALVCTAKGGQMHPVPPASAKINRVDTHVTIDLATKEGLATAKWSRDAMGASGMEDRRYFRDLNPKERKAKLDEVCLGTGSSEVVAAELPNLEDPSQPFRMACDIEIGDTDITPEIGRYSYAFMGPWWPETPSFPAATRQTDVIFKYPRIDIVSIDVKAPAGFASKDGPAPVKVDSAFGKYQLFIAKTPAGYHVDRALAITPLKVPVTDYQALHAFFEEVGKNDRTALVFERGSARP